MNKIMFVTALTAFSISVSASSLVKDDPILVGDSFGFVEGPVWDAKYQRFLFSDIPNNKTYSYDLEGIVSVFDENSGYANGLAIDSKGNLWAARHDRKLSYLRDNGEKVIAAATYNGKPLNSPNDLTVKSDGSVWFTDPPFGIQGYGPQKAEEEQPVRGIYRYLDGVLKLVSDELKLPNGIAFSPNESYLYVADTSNGWVYRFNVNGQAISNKTPFAKVGTPSTSEPMADGVEVDQNGNVYIAGPGGVGVFNREGQQIDYIAIDAGHVSNLEIGGKLQDLLMVTAYNKVLLFQMK
ncbi:SMP-30/gluconolactonase/LRE family protein [Vibrio parahaemolyticus]|uniref:SMP-30/gluconolactonase/LRE family protein n=1 Tax=Vibrio parahaemolyticus TaxID=670 RepID=UPI001B81DB82|nr:SMP-30/gluconolactonase/LRE family protein [Vibrio parahaemolyticus]EJE4169163.1 SMP-30/gluconolactonase/LRE family protein [Vibrio parahaemolyticus]MCI9705984.1 SMP-30/gluconolactonase/LRE family protein [Vibrio parahaemolyticus]MDF5484216.1 SMP-30/gluconolactonase/LRE family protein [Vibrio parahaemolyticus]MDG2839800.1 SMP-30/gluconolactonase/LRE family protein [Vibrio parahaemolyticus]HBC3357497.1 SMP-30/gluconolactonase/LRE family protein [Vibrio parahaemolyticus]